MINLKANTFSEGVGVESEFQGKDTDLGIEGLHIIAVLMSEIKKTAPNVHRAMIGTLAECSSILLGDYVGDEEIHKGGMN